jgi:hypothetical protein
VNYGVSTRDYRLGKDRSLYLMIPELSLKMVHIVMLILKVDTVRIERHSCRLSTASTGLPCFCATNFA